MTYDKAHDGSHWRTVLDQQGRTIRWLAKQTGQKPRTVYAWSQGKNTGDRSTYWEWLLEAGRVLGQEVTG